MGWKYRVVLILLATVTVRHVLVTISNHMKCNHDVLQQMCSLYKKGNVTGPLCDDLCNSTRLKIGQCLSSVPEKKVFGGSWMGKEIILKQAQYWFDQLEGIDFPHNHTESIAMERIKDIIIRHFGRCGNCKKVVAEFMQHADGNGDGIVSQVEAKTFLALILYQEPFMTLLLNGSKHSVDFYGYCGGIYFVEKVPFKADSVFGSSVVFQDYMFPDVFDQLDEFLRSLSAVLLNQQLMKSLKISNAVNFIASNVASIIYRNIYQERVPNLQEKFIFAKSLLEALQALSENEYGALQFCDSHMGNFGLTNDSVVKLIDYDQYFGQSYIINGLERNKCEDGCSIGSDEDCFADCDNATGFCSSDLKSQDLHNTCSSLFRTIFKRTAYEELVNPEDAGARCQFDIIAKLIHKCREIPVSSNVNESRRNVDMVKRLLTTAEEEIKRCI